jgi:hypothetical protein
MGYKYTRGAVVRLRRVFVGCREEEGKGKKGC